MTPGFEMHQVGAPTLEARSVEHRSITDLGVTHTLCLQTLHHFSFAGYHDDRWERFGAIRTLNQVVLAPRSELPPQPLDGVDLVIFVRKGVVEHTGAFTAGCRTVAGEVRLISSAAGIEHGVHNPGAQPAEYIELRLIADRRVDRPLQRVTAFPTRDRKDRLVTLASGLSSDRAPMLLHAPARISAIRMRGDYERIHAPATQASYVFCVAGRVAVGAVTLGAGEAAIIRRPAASSIRALAGSELIIVETE